MNFLIWYGIGLATVVITLFVDALLHSPKDRQIRRAFYELYNIFYKKADLVSTTILVVISLLGPLLTVIFVYFITSDWLDTLAVDENNKKIYPWSGE